MCALRKGNTTDNKAATSTLLLSADGKQIYQPVSSPSCPLSIATVEPRLLAAHERMKNRGPRLGRQSNSSSFLGFFLPFCSLTSLASTIYFFKGTRSGKQIYEISFSSLFGFCHQTQQILHVKTGRFRLFIFFSTCTTPHRHSQSTTFECSLFLFRPFLFFLPALYIVTSRDAKDAIERRNFLWETF